MRLAGAALCGSWATLSECSLGGSVEDSWGITIGVDFPELRREAMTVKAFGKVLELLEVVQFKSLDVMLNFPQLMLKLKLKPMWKTYFKILQHPTLGVYSGCRDRVIAWMLSMKSFARESIQQLLRWGWRYNKNLEEQAAQLYI